MIVFPILNFVLPLIYTSFLLVGNPQLNFTESSKKTGLRVSESKKNEALEQSNQAVIKADLSEEMHSGDVHLQIPAGKDE